MASKNLACTATETPLGALIVEGAVHDAKKKLSS